MVAASLYIIVCSARNRARVRLRRLREPRYLIGAIVGVAYMYFSFFGRLRGARSSAARNSARARRDGTGPALSTLPAVLAARPAVTRIAIVAAALTRASLAAPPSSIRAALQLVGAVSLQPLPRIVLWPFVAITRPLFLFSAPAGTYLAALAASAVVLAMSTAWVLKSDE